MKNILIVDDYVDILETLKELVEDFVDNIYLAENGIEALKILKKEDVACVLSDLHMPEMNGIELIKSARKHGMEVPFIFFTAYGNEEVMCEALEYGAFDFIKKPDFTEVQKIVEAAFKYNFNRHNIFVQKENFINEYQELLAKKNNSK